MTGILGSSGSQFGVFMLGAGPSAAAGSTIAAAYVTDFITVQGVGRFIDVPETGRFPVVTR